MKYLTPEIEALSKHFEVTKSLIQQNQSCGIFQNIEYKNTYVDVNKYQRKS